MLKNINNIHDISKLNNKELYELAIDVRKELIRCISNNGGHLASNLGIVELTISLFKNYNFDDI